MRSFRRPPLYVHYHERILAAVDTVLPVDKVLSIDEMQFKLIGTERTPQNAERLALRLKQAVRKHVGEQMTCSVGAAPNAFLAKLATDLQKPDGLVILQAGDLPDRLRGLRLTEFAGINRRMEARLQAAGIFNSDGLVDASRAELERAFGSVVGARWWYLLRGYELGLPDNERRSLGHSHVLPPDMRSDDGAYKVLLRLAQKACARLRSNGLYASSMHLSVQGFTKSWSAKAKLPSTQDSVAVNAEIAKLWAGRCFVRPRVVGITFGELSERQVVTPSLFDVSLDNAELNRAIDHVNQKFGKNTIYLAALERARDAADEKIAFNKTSLFREGKDDNLWPAEDGDKPPA